MVGSRVDSIDANDVGVDLLEVRNITATGVAIGKRIGVCCVRARGAVG